MDWTQQSKTDWPRNLISTLQYTVLFASIQGIDTLPIEPALLARCPTRTRDLCPGHRTGADMKIDQRKDKSPRAISSRGILSRASARITGIGTETGSTTRTIGDD